ncbi:MAG: O-antigen ligase family protein [Solirubrobacterales bacterium]|nr:O-antigen ligase family protein [Solirubrobacterales bacterium]
MSTAELLRARAGGPAVERSGLIAIRRGDLPLAPTALGGALLVVLLYAVYAHGAVASSNEERLQVAVAALAVLAVGPWLWSGALRFSAPALAWAGLLTLAVFAAWSGASVIWSVAPDQTWLELDRIVTYLLVLSLAIAVGASHPRMLELVATGLLALVATVTLYALGQKLVPGVHIGRLVSFNQAGPLPRLQQPLGYWNALALLIAIGVPVALAVLDDRSRSRSARLASLALLVAMLLAIAFTYSRGGLLALGAALAVGVACSGARLRWLMWLAIACLAAAPSLLSGLTSHQLTAAGIALGQREAAGGKLAAVLLGSLVVLLVLAAGLMRLERQLVLERKHTRRIGMALAALALAALAAGVLAVGLSSRGIGGTASHAWRSFTATRATSTYDPHRLLSADSENRWVWWKEASGAFSDRPVTGWGAGSFSVVHLLYRRQTLSVQQPHSLPLQLLAETGAVGAALALGGLALLVLAAARGVPGQTPGRGRLLYASLLAALVAFVVHLLYDWDWDLPGVALPALVSLGVLVGSRRAGRGGPASGLPHPAALARRAPGLVRAVGLAGAILFLCAFAVSAILPRLAASKAAAALVSSSGGSPDALARAQSEAALADKLDPLSDVGLRAESTIAIHRGQLSLARAELLVAVKRDPTDAQAWEELAVDDYFLRDPREGALAVRRALQLDPRGTIAGGLAQRLTLALTPPQASPTAVPAPGSAPTG